MSVRQSFVRLGLVVALAAGGVLAAAAPAAAASTALDTPKFLQAEQVTNPLGIDVPAPRLSWRVAPLTAGATIQASQLQVARTAADLGAGTGLVSDVTTAGGATDLVYPGPTGLAGNQRFFWHVRVQDSTGAWTAWSATNFWQMGMLADSNWQGAQWIASSDAVGAPQFRTDFTLPASGSSISWASVTVAGVGVHLVRLNGAAVDDHQLDPAFTNYSKRILYVTHNIAPSQLVAGGANTLGLVLGSGWYDPDEQDTWGTYRAPWSPGHELVRALLTVRYADGSTTFVKTDTAGNWTTSRSETTWDAPYGGESVDLTKVQAGWDAPGFAPSTTWSPAVSAVPPAGAVLDAQIMPAMTKAAPIALTGAPTAPPNTTGTWLYKLASTTAGWAQIRITGTAGQVVSVDYGDAIDPTTGQILKSNIKVSGGGRWQHDEFTLDGQADVLEPRFTYKGFTYLQISGVTSPPDAANDITVYPVHTALPVTGSFTSSDATLNAVHAMDVRTFLNNVQGLPTDGPQREKMGWLGDAQLASENGLGNFDVVALYEKFLADMRDSQQASGVLPDLVPSAGFGNDGKRFDTWWGGALMTIPWNLFRFRGDVTALSDNYATMKALMNYLESRATGNLIPGGATGSFEEAFGDHVSPNTVNVTDLGFMQTAGYLSCARIMAAVAHVLGATADESSYATLANNIAAAMNAQWYDAAAKKYRVTNTLGTKTTQTSLALALTLDMVPASDRASVASQLVSQIQADGTRIETGIIGTKYLLQALDAMGRDDLAYTLITGPDNSYAEMLALGATAVKESWTDKSLPDFPALTSVEGWIYDAVAGMHTDSFDPAAAVTIAPNPVGSMTSATAVQRRGSGSLQTKWTLVGSTFTLTVTVPVGMTVDVSLPHASAAGVTEDGSTVAATQVGTRAVVAGVGAGTHVLTSTYS